MADNRLKGLYLVVDTTIPEDRLLAVLRRAAAGGVNIVQIWGNWERREDALALSGRIVALAREHGQRVLINKDPALAREVDADGVHFDDPRMTPDEARAVMGAGRLVGYTCGNDIDRVEWAQQQGADYISFCSIFPSPSVDECEIVPLTMVRAAKERVRIPVFASGGITPDNVGAVLDAGADGIAVISAILKADDPEAAARTFADILAAHEAATPL